MFMENAFRFRRRQSRRWTPVLLDRASV